MSIRLSQTTKSHFNSAETRRVWLNLLRWTLIVSNVPVGIYIGTICGNIFNYVGQSPDGLFALGNIRAVENQILILRFLSYWAKHRVMGTLIVLLVPISALGGRWAVRSIQRENKQYLMQSERGRIDRELDKRITTLRQQILQEVLESLASDVVIQLYDASQVTSQMSKEHRGRGYGIEVSEVKTTVYPVDDNLSVEEEGPP